MEAAISQRFGAGRRVLDPARILLGYGALAGMLAVSLFVAAAAAAGPSFLVPSAHSHLPSWIAGVFAGTHLLLSGRNFALCVVALCIGYAAALACASALSRRIVLTAIVGLHVVFMLAPPLLSTDLFSYVAYARLGAIHHLDPYVHGPIAAPHDPIFRFVGSFWDHTRSAYGPIFTIGSYPLALLGVTASLWGLKVIAAASSLAVIALVHRCARRVGRDPLIAAMLVGLNPMLLLYAVGGGHNDMLMLAIAMAGVALVLAGRTGAGAGAVIVSAAVKVSSIAILPFLVAASPDRRRALAGALVAGVATAALGAIFFGPHALGFIAVLRGNQQLVSGTSSVSDLTALFGPLGDTRVFTILILAGGVPYLLWRVLRHRMDWIAASGWTLLALTYTTSFLLAWYTIWSLPFAALTRDRRLLAATLLVQILFLIHRLPPLAVLQ